MKKSAVKIILLLLLFVNISCSNVNIKKSTQVKNIWKVQKHFFVKELEKNYDIEKLEPKDYILDNQLYKYEDAILMMCFFTMTSRIKVNSVKRDDGSKERDYLYDPSPYYYILFEEPEKEEIIKGVLLPEEKNGVTVDITNKEAMQLLKKFTKDTLIPYIHAHTKNIKMKVIEKEDVKNIPYGKVTVLFSDEINDDKMGMAYFPGVIMLNPSTLFTKQKGKNEYTRGYYNTLSHEFLHIFGIMAHAQDAYPVFPKNEYSQNIAKYIEKESIINTLNEERNGISNLMSIEELKIVDLINSSDYRNQLSCENYANYLMKYISTNRYRVGSLMLKEAIEKKDLKLLKKRIEALKKDDYFIEYLLYAKYCLDESIIGRQRFRLSEKKMIVGDRIIYKLEGLRDEIERYRYYIKIYEKEIEKGQEVLYIDENGRCFFGESVYNKKDIENIKKNKKSQEDLIENKYKKLLKDVEDFDKIYIEASNIVDKYIPKELLKIEREDESLNIPLYIIYPFGRIYETEYKYREKYVEYMGSDGETGTIEKAHTSYFKRMKNYIQENNPYVIEICLNEFEFMNSLWAMKDNIIEAEKIKKRYTRRMIIDIGIMSYKFDKENYIKGKKISKEEEKIMKEKKEEYIKEERRKLIEKYKDRLKILKKKK